MVKTTSSKGLLLSWLEDALNKKKFKGLRWSDESKKIFYINWTHKSSEQWSASEVQVYEAWAAFKGKLKNKNSKQLKATFRCALNSKKQLKEVHKTRTKRYWQFIDPATSRENETGLKKKQAGEESKTQIIKKTEYLQRRTLNADDLMTSTTNMDSFGISTLDVDDLVTSSLTSTVNGINFSNRLLSVDDSSSDNAKNSRIENLPTFESAFSSSAYLTPPYKTNESLYGVLPDYGISYSPYDQNRLTPPAETMLTSYKHSTYSDEFALTETNSNVWQPNFLTIPNCTQNPTPLFYDDADSMNFSLNLSSGHKINFSTSNLLTPVMENTENCNSTVCDAPTSMEEDCPLNPDAYDIQYVQLVEELNSMLPTETEMHSS